MMLVNTVRFESTLAKFVCHFNQDHTITFVVRKWMGGWKEGKTKKNQARFEEAHLIGYMLVVHLS